MPRQLRQTSMNTFTNDTLLSDRVMTPLALHLPPTSILMIDWSLPAVTSPSRNGKFQYQTATFYPNFNNADTALLMQQNNSQMKLRHHAYFRLFEIELIPVFFVTPHRQIMPRRKYKVSAQHLGPCNNTRATSASHTPADARQRPRSVSFAKLNFKTRSTWRRSQLQLQIVDERETHAHIDIYQLKLNITSSLHYAEGC